MTTATPKLALPYLQPGQALKTITHNEALQRLDGGLYLSCSDMNADALPENPAEGLCLVLSPDAGDPPLEHAADIGIYRNGTWDWFTPGSGFIVWDEAGETLRVFDGETWAAPFNHIALATLPQLGLNTSATAAQRLALASETSLFSHDGSSHRMSVNRAAETDVASLIFQTDFAGEAEIGLTGTQGFSVKTSDDGVNWAERLTTPNDYAGLRAPAFGSIRAYIGSNTAQFIETPATGGIFAITIVSDGQFPRVSHSGLIAYDTGQSPALVVLAKTARLDVHGDMILDGTISEPDNIGVSAVDGGIYVENRINNQRVISLTFLC